GESPGVVVVEVPAAAVGVVGSVGQPGVEEHVGPRRSGEDGQGRAVVGAAGEQQRTTVALSENAVEGVAAIAVGTREAELPAIELALIDEGLWPGGVVGSAGRRRRDGEQADGREYGEDGQAQQPAATPEEVSRVGTPTSHRVPPPLHTILWQE